MNQTPYPVLPIQVPCTKVVSAGLSEAASAASSMTETSAVTAVPHLWCRAHSLQLQGCLANDCSALWSSWKTDVAPLASHPGWVTLTANHGHCLQAWTGESCPLTCPLVLLVWSYHAWRIFPEKLSAGTQGGQ